MKKPNIYKIMQGNAEIEREVYGGKRQQTYCEEQFADFGKETEHMEETLLINLGITKGDGTSATNIIGLAGSIMLYNGQVHFHRSITHTMDFLVGVAKSTVQTLRNVIDVISLALANELDLLFVLEGQQQTVVDLLNRKLKDAANTLELKTNDNHDKIKRVLNAVCLALVCLAAVMLTLAFAGLVSSLCGLRRVVYSLVLILWLLVTATLIPSGIFFLLSK